MLCPVADRVALQHLPDAAVATALAVLAVLAVGAAAALMLGGCAAREAWTTAPGTQSPQSFRREVRTEVEGRLLLYLPRDFDARDRSRRWPLLVFLHGSGEAGRDLDRLLVNGPPKRIRAGADLPFVVASPQAPVQLDHGTFDPVMLDGLLDELLERLPIDRDRVYLTGLSAGGIWTYGLATRRPERFAAIAPVCATWDPADACRLRDVPVWAFHGERDDVVPLAGGRAMVDAINACGGTARLTVYAGVGHDAWTPAYDDPQLYEWLLAQRRRTPGTTRSR
jgi:predicted peptidase